MSQLEYRTSSSLMVGLRIHEGEESTYAYCIVLEASTLPALLSDLAISPKLIAIVG